MISFDPICLFRFNKSALLATSLFAKGLSSFRQVILIHMTSLEFSSISRHKSHAWTHSDYSTELCANRAPVIANLSSGPEPLYALGRGGVLMLAGME
jgi:hypothetical protein